MKQPAKPDGRLLPLLLAATAAVYATSLPGILFWDSEVLILNNVFLRSWSYLPDIWTTSVLAGGGQVTNYYRPVPVTIFLALYQAWGPAPWAYHAFTVLCHLAAAAGLFLWIRRLAGEKTAFWSVLAFALHPVQNETVNYVDHVEGILAFVFGVSALLLHARGRRAASLAALTFSLLSKEEGVVFLPMLAAYEWLRPGEEKTELSWSARRRRLLALWPHAALLAVFIALRLTVFNFLKLPVAQFGAQAGTFGSLGLRLLTFARAFWHDLRLWALPVGLHFDRDMDPTTSWADPWAWGAVLGALVLFAGLRRLIKEDRLGRFGLACFAAAFIPYCGLVPFNNLLAEHFLYIPTAGLVLTLAAVLRSRLTESTVPAARGVMLILLVFWTAQNLRRNRDWQSAERLYRTTLAGNPTSFRAANNLGAEYFRRGDPGAARRAFETALAARPDYAPALNNVGAVVEGQGKFDEALRWYQSAGRSDPSYALAHKNAAGILIRLKDWAGAEASARKALAAHPQYGSAWNLLAAALFHQGKTLEAVAAFERAAAFEPSQAAFLNLALAYNAAGDKAKAQAARQAAARYP